MRERRRAATPIANSPRGESVGSRSRDGDRRAKRVGQHLYPRRREWVVQVSHYPLRKSPRESYRNEGDDECFCGGATKRENPRMAQPPPVEDADHLSRAKYNPPRTRCRREEQERLLAREQRS